MPEINKSQAIRDYYKVNPKAKTQEVVDALAKKGITVTTGLVRNVKSTHNKKQAARKAAKSSKQPGPPQPRPRNPESARPRLSRTSTKRTPRPATRKPSMPWRKKGSRFPRTISATSSPTARSGGTW